MPSKQATFCARGHFPQAHLLVGLARSQSFAVRRKSQVSEHSHPLQLHPSPFLARTKIPKIDRRIGRRMRCLNGLGRIVGPHTDEGPTVRGKSYEVGVPVELPKLV